MAKSVQIKVALIGAAATIMAALIIGILGIGSDPPSPSKSQDMTEFTMLDSAGVVFLIEILEHRAKIIQLRMELYDSMITRDMTSMFDFSLDSLRLARKKFNDLHFAHLEALRSGNQVLAHEINRDILAVISFLPSGSGEDRLLYYPF